MEFSSRMEDELKCPSCHRLFTNPVTLSSCTHSVCLHCAIRLQTPAPYHTSSSLASRPSGDVDDCGSISSSSYSTPVRPSSGEDAGLGGSVLTPPSEAGSDSSYPDSDGMSMVSESDSGVICGSRPDSCLSATASIGNLTQLSGTSQVTLY